MRIIDLTPTSSPSKCFCATIGIFEGVHLAHQALIEECKRVAKLQDLASCIITFNLQTSLAKVTNQIPLFEEEDKLLRLSNTGIDRLIVIDFDENFKAMSHQDFMMLLTKNQIRHLVVGFDFTYGFQGQGNVNTILEDSQGIIKTTIIPKKTINDQKIGTTQIKEYLALGNIEAANQLLGFPYYIKIQGGQAPQVSLLKDGKYQVLINKAKQMITIQNGKLVDYHGENTATITFLSN